MKIFVQVKPGAHKNEALSFVQGILTLKLRAQAIDGKANEALILFLSEFFGIPQTHLKILKGLTSRKKHVEIMEVKKTSIEYLLKLNSISH